MRTYAGVIVSGANGRIALQQRHDRPDVVNPGRVTVFGGLSEGDETPSATACRELREELGLTVTAAQLDEVLVRDKIEHDGRPTRCVIYALAVSEVDDLQVSEGVGCLVGPPAVLLADGRLTETCALAVRAFAGNTRF